MSSNHPESDVGESSDFEALLPQSTKGSSNSQLATSKTGYYHSYQHEPPAVRQMSGDAIAGSEISNNNRTFRYFGDASLRPNTGRTNSYEYALFGLAWHELLDRLRLSIILNSMLLVIVLFFTWWTRLFRPFHLLEMIILSLLTVTLLVVEVMSIFQSAGPNSASTSSNDQSSSNNIVHGGNKLALFLQYTEQFGLLVLHHPIGKILYLVVCGCMCWWIGGLQYLVLGLWLIMNAGILLYCWVTYSEFRQTFASQSSNGSTNDSNNSTDSTTDRSGTNGASWSYYYYQAASTSVSHLTDRVSETTSQMASSWRR